MEIYFSAAGFSGIFFFSPVKALHTRVCGNESVHVQSLSRAVMTGTHIHAEFSHDSSLEQKKQGV